MPARKPGRRTAPVSAPEILDTLLPALVAKATGQKLKDRDGKDVELELDAAMVDRVLKVLDLQLKYKQAESAPRGRRGTPSWREPDGEE